MPIESGGSASLPLPSGASTLTEQEAQTLLLGTIAAATDIPLSQVESAVSALGDGATLNDLLGALSTGLDVPASDLLAKLTAIDITLSTQLDVPLSDVKTQLVAANSSLDAIEADADAARVAAETTASTGATAANQTAANSKLDTLLTQTDGLEGSAITTATNTGTTATNTTAIAGSVDQLEGYVDGLEGKLDTLIAKFTDVSVDNNLGASVSKTVKSGAGRIVALSARHADAASLYLWIFDNTAASGTSLIVPTLIPASGQVILGADFFSQKGFAFSTGLTYGFSTSGSSYSAYGTAANCFVTVAYS